MQNGKSATVQRQIVLDTETTGLDPARGHRIIEIGCVELINRRLTGSHYHCYLQPDRQIEREAGEVHGITDEFLKDRPRFADIAGEFLDFVSGAELIIHNAPFDLGFLDHELRLCGRGRRRMTDFCQVLDTLQLARQRHPGQKNSLDALCRRYDIDNAQRTLHGALLDAEILADVYLAMTREQVALGLAAEPASRTGQSSRPRATANRPPLVVRRAGPEERAAHERYLELLDRNSAGSCLWKRLE